MHDLALHLLGSLVRRGGPRAFLRVERAVQVLDKGTGPLHVLSVTLAVGDL